MMTVEYAGSVTEKRIKFAAVGGEECCFVASKGDCMSNGVLRRKLRGCLLRLGCSDVPRGSVSVILHRQGKARARHGSRFLINNTISDAD
jgi:hypothetical protein